MKIYIYNFQDRLLSSYHRYKLMHLIGMTHRIVNDIAEIDRRNNYHLKNVAVISSFVWAIDFEDNKKATMKLYYASPSLSYANFDIVIKYLLI